MGQKKLNVTLRRSIIGCAPVQRKTVKALGLGKIDSSVVKDDTPEIRGMLKKVNHLVEVEEVDEGKVSS